VTGEGQSVPYAFAHVTESDRGRLRVGYAQVLQEKVARHAPSVRLRPPDGQPPMPGVELRGCLFCGVGAVRMPAARVVQLGGQRVAERTVWRQLSTKPEAIGGQRSPDRVSGWVCPGCADAVDSVGSIGQTAMRKALVVHLRGSGRAVAAQRLATSDNARLVGWGVTGQAAANEQPWEHISLAV
jgi:hypothetical protein